MERLEKKCGEIKQEMEMGRFTSRSHYAVG